MGTWINATGIWKMGWGWMYIFGGRGIMDVSGRKDIGNHLFESYYFSGKPLQIES